MQDVTQMPEDGRVSIDRSMEAGEILVREALKNRALPDMRETNDLMSVPCHVDSYGIKTISEGDVEIDEDRVCIGGQSVALTPSISGGAQRRPLHAVVRRWW